MFYLLASNSLRSNERKLVFFALNPWQRQTLSNNTIVFISSAHRMLSDLIIFLCERKRIIPRSISCIALSNELVTCNLLEMVLFAHSDKWKHRSSSDYPFLTVHKKMSCCCHYYKGDTFWPLWKQILYERLLISSHLK